MKTRLMKTALVAAVAGLALLGTATAASADPETKAAEGKVSSEKGIGVYGEHSDGAQSAHPLVLTTDGGKKQYVYCIDLMTSLLDHTYTEEDWATSGVKNLGKIKWILTNSYPNVDAAGVLSAAKATLPDTYSAQEKNSFVYAATQASIWHFSDNYVLRAKNSTTADEDVDTAVSKIYDYLTKNAADMPDPGEPKLSFSGPTKGKIGDKVGPIKVDANVGEITLTVTGGKAVDKDGKEITKAKGGDEFYLTSDKPGTVTVTGQGELNVPTGRIFVSTQGADTSQKLILAGALVKKGEGKFEVSLENRPALAVTGTSVTIIGVSGAALLAGGAAFVLFLRRRRAAANTWGGEEDGLA